MLVTNYRMMFSSFLKESEKEAGDAENELLKAGGPVNRTGDRGSRRGAEEGQEDVSENSNAAAQVCASIRVTDRESVDVFDFRGFDFVIKNTMAEHC